MSAASDTQSAPISRRRGLGGSWLRYLLMAIVPLALIAVAAYFYITSGRFESTDDAYVQADTVAISSNVAGRVVAVAVHENQKVKAGQLLFRLNDAPFRIALERAQAQLAAARLEVEGMRATYRQRQADLKAAQDTVAYTQREFQRQQQLLQSHVTTQEKVDAARHSFDAARAQITATQEQIANTLASLGGNPDIPAEQHPLVQQAQAQVDQAKLDLSYTVISAPADGTVTNVSKLPVGQYLNAATPAFALVATHPWIEANFKETQLTRIREGQPVTVDIDTYPDHTFTGHVESIGAGTGSEFSVLPPQNATGNWVKVAQRIPVRVAIDDADPDQPLRAGMSATVEIDTRHVPSVASAGATPTS